MCSGCQNDKAYQTHGYVSDEGVYVECCDRCGDLASSDIPVPDVFWNGRPYYSEALGMEFTSRTQKARVMKELGVSELGGRKLGEKNWTEGSREFRRKQFNRERPMIQKTYQAWKEKSRASH